MARLMFCNVENNKIKKSVDKKIPKISINERRKIVDKVKTLSKDVHMEIFYFLKRKINEDYTINQNGVFINLNNIDNNILYELREMVNFYYKNEKKLKESYIERYCNKNPFDSNNSFCPNNEEGTDSSILEDIENKVNDGSENEEEKIEDDTDESEESDISDSSDNDTD